MVGSVSVKKRREGRTGRVSRGLESGERDGADEDVAAGPLRDQVGI